jgi:hypothetical protein
MERSMPCEPSKLAKLNMLLDAYLEARKAPDFYDDEDEDEDVINPLSAPKPLGDGEGAGGPPQQIHGEGKRDLFK